jgi:hypothetical protein
MAASEATRDRLMKKTLALALFALVTATAAQAGDDPAPEAPASEKKICRTEQMTGSRTRRTRICMTEAQWHELSSRSQQNLDRYSNLQTGRRDGAGQAQ